MKKKFFQFLMGYNLVKKLKFDKKIADTSFKKEIIKHHEAYALFKFKSKKKLHILLS